MEYKNNKKILSFVLDNGKRISNTTAISNIQSGKIFNAKVITRNGVQEVIAKNGFNIPTEKITIVRRNGSKSNIVLPFSKLNDNDLPSSNIHFERTLYKELLKWKEKGTTALFLKGPRQVGKTYLLEQFGKKEFEKYIYVNLSQKESYNKFMTIYYKIKELNKFGSSLSDIRLFWLNIFALYDEDFVDSKETLIFIDEIQDIPEIYNSIRELNRCLYSCVCFSGSYIGITQFKSVYKNFAGDYENLELQSLSYIEFLQAMGIYEEFLKIREIDRKILSNEELRIYSEVEKYYNIYCIIGGYPAVVKNYIITKDINSCLRVVGNFLEDFYAESSRYLSDILETALWFRTFTLVAQDLIGKSNNLKANSLGYLRNNSEDMTIRYKDKNLFLGWLESCHIISACGIYTSFKPICESADARYYFNDLGILTYICRSNPMFIESDIKGVLAENFVFLFLKDNLYQVGRKKEFVKIQYYIHIKVWMVILN